MSDHILDLLGAYLDGELHDRELIKVEAHLAECPDLPGRVCSTCKPFPQHWVKYLAPDFSSPERLAANVSSTPAAQDRQPQPTTKF